MHWLVVALLARQGRAPCPMPRSRAGKRRTRVATWLVAVTVGALLPAFASEAVDLLSEDEKLLPIDGAPLAEFGISVAISGDRAVVGAQQDGNRGAAYVFRDDGTAWVEEAKLTASDAAAGDSFGVSVAVVGDLAVVGANLDDDNGNASGSAYVFRYDGTAWVEEAKLTASDAAAGDSFGVSVAVVGDLAVVGANLDDDNGNASGSAYVFRYDGTAWVEEAKLLATDGEALDWFGISVAISVAVDGDVIVVGVPHDSFVFGAGPAPNHGSAYVFRYDGTGWVQEAKLLEPFVSVSSAGNEFGRAVAVDGDVTVVGVWLDDTPDSDQQSGNLTDHGAAWVYRFNGTTWVAEAKLLNPDLLALGGPASIRRRKAEYDRLGRAVAIAGDTIVTGSFGDGVNGEDAGSARVFRYDGATMRWVTRFNEDLLTAADADVGDQLGISVSVDGDYVVAGAWWNDGNGDESGSAYVFEDDGTAWVEEHKLVASDGEADDFAAFSVGLAGDKAVVGAFAHRDNGNNSGSAYVFTVPEPSTLALQIGALVTLGALAGHARRARGRVVER